MIRLGQEVYLEEFEAYFQVFLKEKGRKIGDKSVVLKFGSNSNKKSDKNQDNCEDLTENPEPTSEFEKIIIQSKNWLEISLKTKNSISIKKKILDDFSFYNGNIKLLLEKLKNFESYPTKKRLDVELIFSSDISEISSAYLSNLIKKALIDINKLGFTYFSNNFFLILIIIPKNLIKKIRLCDNLL